jgi:glutathionyl-hydroquinone reductase
MGNQQDIIRLLRAVANSTDAKSSSRDIIFNAAADEIERLQRIIDSRPAINAGLPETYIKWSQEIYVTEVAQVMQFLN